LARDSYGLFDYETTNYHNQNFVLSHPGKLTRLNDEIIYQNFSDENKRTRRSSEDINLEETILYALETLDGIKINVEATDPHDANQIWHVAEGGENIRGQILKPQDIIKLGRVMFRINKIKVGKTKDSKKQMSRKSIIKSIKDHMQMRESFIIENATDDDEKGRSRKGSNAALLCKICLYEKSEEEDDPLISPCKCTGSVKFVHLKCMQNWIKSKLNMEQNNNIITILWKNLNCELCKEKLPITLHQNGEDFSLVPFTNKISESYVVLESFSKEKDSTGIHLIDLSSNQSFKIGRGHDCDLKISDISVSRVHAILAVSKGNLYLKDNSSKFGTLILNRSPLFFNYEHTKSGLIQCGRTLFRFTLKRPWLSYIPCLGSFFATNQNYMQAVELDAHFPNKAADETSVKIIEDEDEVKRDGRPTMS